MDLIQNIEDTNQVCEELDEGNTIFSYPFKHENEYYYQYRFIKENNEYLIQIIKVFETEDFIDTVLYKTILTIKESELETTIHSLMKNTSLGEEYTEFLNQIKIHYLDE